MGQGKAAAVTGTRLAATAGKTVKRTLFMTPCVAIVFLGIYTLLLYSNTFTASFHYDDYPSIIGNKPVQWEALSWENFKDLVAQEYERPVSYISFALNYYFGGLDVRGYHYVNTVIHALSSFGLFLLLRNILSLTHPDMGASRRYAVAFVSSMLWLSSPLQTQAVTYIVQRMASLAAMFYVYAVYFYLKGRSTCGRKRLLFFMLTMTAALLAFGSKQNAYTLPFYLLLLEIIVIRRGSLKFLANRRLLAVLSLLLAGFVAILFRIYYSPLVATPGPWFIYQIKTRFLTGLRSILFYMSQLILPVPSRMSLEHDFALSRSLLEPPATVLAALIIGGLLFYALATFKKYPIFSFSILWFFGNLSLETFNPYLIYVFEHRLYLPSMFFFFPFVILISQIWTLPGKRNMKKPAAVLCLLMVIVSFSMNTYIRNSVWHDEYSLWRDVLDKNPSNVNGYIGLGSAYVKDDLYDDALPLYLAGKSLSPRNPVVRYSLGVVYFHLKLYDKAVDEFAYLGSMGYVSIGNETSISYYFSRIAKNYYGHGRDSEALSVLDMALTYDPGEPSIEELREKMAAGILTFEEIMEN